MEAEEQGQVKETLCVRGEVYLKNGKGVFSLLKRWKTFKAKGKSRKHFYLVYLFIFRKTVDVLFTTAWITMLLLFYAGVYKNKKNTGRQIKRPEEM